MKKIVLSLIALTALIANVNSQIPTTGLISHYPFNNNVNDEFGSNHGTNSGAVAANDRFGNSASALYLNGVNASVDFGDINLINPDFSISFWLSYEAVAAGESARILSKRAVCSTGNMIDIAINTSSIGMEVYSGSNNSANAAGSGTTSTNTWYHVVFVVDQVSQETRQYTDGVLSSTNSWASAVGSIDNSASFGISTSPCIPIVNSTIAYKGLVDDIRIYNRPVNQTEVTALFNEGNTAEIIESSYDNQVAIYPNPATSIIKVDTEEKLVSLAIFDITGSLVQQELTNSFSIENLESGIYTINIVTSKGVAYSRFVKK